MTKDNWLTVAMIIAVIITAAATLLGPVLAVIVQLRISQPKPTPDTNQPKRSNRIFSIAHFIARYGSVLGIILAIILLIVRLRRTTPLTRSDVFFIAFAAAAIFYYVLSLLLLFIATRVFEYFRRQNKAIRSIAKILQTIPSVSIESLEATQLASKELPDEDEHSGPSP